MMEQKNNLDIKFTIITVCYNSAEVIEKTFESVLSQIYTPYEYILVDGLSTDNTVEIAKTYIERFREKNINFLIYSEKDNGIYEAMNKGINYSSGDFISFLNSGDWYENDTLFNVRKLYLKDGFDLCYGSINYYMLDGSFLIKKSKLDKLFITSRHWNHPSMFLKADIYKKNLFDESFKIYSDFELYLRVRKITKKVSISSDVLANFVADGISTKPDYKTSKKRAKEKYKAYRKNGYSILYWFESYCWEFFKMLYFKVHKEKKKKC